MATAAARYGAARSALGLLGPLAWAWLGADLMLRALGTDYCRVVRAVFALAQVRPPDVVAFLVVRAQLHRAPAWNRRIPRCCRGSPGSL